MAGRGNHRAAGHDAAGKDSTIKHVMSASIPKACGYILKQPNARELSHDYLWRIGQCLPARGQIAIFNRSHYEDELAVDVLKLYENFKMPSRCLTEDFIPRPAQADRSIRGIPVRQRHPHGQDLFAPVQSGTEKALPGTAGQAGEKLEILQLRPGEPALWDAYQEAYERTINATATRHCPWYVLPADDKWFTRYLVSEAVLDALQRINPQFPELPPEQADKLPLYRRQLAQED